MRASSGEPIIARPRARQSTDVTDGGSCGTKWAGARVRARDGVAGRRPAHRICVHVRARPIGPSLGPWLPALEIFDRELVASITCVRAASWRGRRGASWTVRPVTHTVARAARPPRRPHVLPLSIHASPSMLVANVRRRKRAIEGDRPAGRTSRHGQGEREPSIHRGSVVVIVGCLRLLAAGR